MTVSDTWSDWKTTAALDTPPSTATPEIDKELRNIKAQVKANVVPGRWTADDAGLTALITDIGSDQAEIVFDSSLTINPSGATYTIPANITIKAVKPGIFAIANNKTLALNGPIDAGRFQVFSWTGSGKVVVGNGQDVYPEWWGALGDGSTEDTAAFDAAAVCWPTDIYGIQAGTIRLSQKTYVVDTLSTWGYSFRLMGASKSNSVLQSKSGNTVLDIDGDHTHSFEIGNLKILGNGGSGHGIYIHNMTFGYNIHDVYITNVGGKGIYDIGGFSNVYRNIYIDGTGDHAVEGSFVTLDNVYVSNVGSGKCGFRIYNSPVMISCNGIGAGGDYWGIFGYDPAEGDTGYLLTYSNATLINCNIEDFKITGILCRPGSSPALRDGTVFLGEDATADLTAVTLQGGSPNTMSFWEGVKLDPGAGSTWKNDLPFHTNGGPPCIYMDLAHDPQTQYYDDTAGAAKTLPRITQAYVAYLQYGLVLNATAIGDFDAGNYVVINGEGNMTFHGTASVGGSAISAEGSVPTTGTYKQGAVVFNSAASTGQPAGWMCVTTGTFSAYSTTGTTDGLTATVTSVGSTAAVSVGDYVTIATTTNGPFRVVSKTSNTLVVSPTPDTAGVGVAIATSDPTFKAMGNLA